MQTKQVFESIISSLHARIEFFSRELNSLRDMYNNVVSDNHKFAAKNEMLRKELKSIRDRSETLSKVSSSSSDDCNLSDHWLHHNDAWMHQGSHYCRRNCSGATFICGCTYQNAQGSWVKCGFISYNSNFIHPCKGSPDYHFESPESNSVIPSKSTEDNNSDWTFNYRDVFDKEWGYYDYDF